MTLPKQEPMKIVELDEMHSYIESKKITAGYGLLLIGLVKGSSILSAEIVLQRQGYPNLIIKLG